MDRLSAEQSLRWTQRFVAQEWQLALPIALAFIGLPSLVSTLMTTALISQVPQTVAEVQTMVAALPWWYAPASFALILVMLTGGLALIALALLPQVSVGEAIQVAMRRLPAAIAALLLFWAGMLTLMLLVGIAAGTLRLGAGYIALSTLVALVLAGVYYLLLLPLIVDRRQGVIATVRASRRFYRGTTLLVAASLILYVIVSFIVAVAIQVALGSIVLLIARLAGSVDAGHALTALVSSVVAALQATGLFLLVAAFYRQRVGRG